MSEEDTQKTLAQYAAMGLACGIVSYLIIMRLTSFDYMMLKILFSVFAAVFVFSYLISLKIEQRKKILSPQEWFLAGLVVIVNFAFLTQGYHFYDDMWMFTGARENHTQIGIAMARPFHGLLGDLFWFATPQKASIIKLFSIVFLLLVAILLYSWIKEKSSSAWWAFTLSALVCVASSMSDHVGYSSTLSLLPALAAGILSVMLYDGIYEGKSKKNNFMLLFLSFLCIIFSFMLYQIASSVVFFMLAIHIYYTNYNKNLKKMITYLLSYGGLFAVGAGTYYAFSLVLTRIYGISIGARGSFITFTQIADKINYFDIVIKTAVLRIVASLLGDGLFNSRLFFGVFRGASNSITAFILAVSVILIAIAFLSHFLKNRSVLQIVILILFIPASYFPFLILLESGYFTYYAIPLIALLSFYMLSGLKELLLLVVRGCKKVHKERVVGAVAAVFVAVLALQNAFYIQNVWIKPNVIGYEFVKRSLQTRVPDTTRFHIIGTITPGQMSIYSDFAVRQSLRELGYDPSLYNITYSDNPYFSIAVSAVDFEKLRMAAQAEHELYVLESAYEHNMFYHNYHYNHSITEDGQRVLYELFKRSDLIPADLTQVPIIDLRWTQTLLEK